MLLILLCISLFSVNCKPSTEHTALRQQGYVEQFFSNLVCRGIFLYSMSPNFFFNNEGSLSIWKSVFMLYSSRSHEKTASYIIYICILRTKRFSVYFQEYFFYINIPIIWYPASRYCPIYAIYFCCVYSAYTFKAAWQRDIYILSSPCPCPPSTTIVFPLCCYLKLKLHCKLQLHKIDNEWTLKVNAENYSLLLVQMQYVDKAFIS